MSWDISIQDLPKGINTIDEIPGDFAPKTLGKRTDIINRILKLILIDSIKRKIH